MSCELFTTKKKKKPEIKQGTKGRWRWYLRENDELTAQSSIKGYATRKEAEDVFKELFYPDNRILIISILIVGFIIGVMATFLFIKIPF